MIVACATSETVSVQSDAYIACADNLDFMAGVPDESVQLVVTSPPYNIGKAYETKQPLQDYINDQAQRIKEVHRILKSEGSVCWQVGNFVDHGEIMPIDIPIYEIFKELGFKLRNRVVWTYGHGQHCQRRLSPRYETILWFTKSDDYTFNLDPIRVPSKYPNKRHFRGNKKGELSGNPMGKNPSDVWDIPNVKGNHVEKTDHPCQFPVGIVDRLVLSMTQPGDIVLDPYIGSGSTAVSALRHGRRIYGCDINEAYIAITRDRIDAVHSGTCQVRDDSPPKMC